MKSVPRNTVFWQALLTGRAPQPEGGRSQQDWWQESCCYDTYPEYKSSLGMATKRWLPYNVKNFQIHLGKTWGKFYVTKYFDLFFRKKIPPISIVKLEFKMGTENLGHGGGEAHLFHRKNKNISSICHIKEPSTLPHVLGAFYFSMAPLLISASMLQTDRTECITLGV